MSFLHSNHILSPLQTPVGKRSLQITMPTLGTANLLEPLLVKEIVVSSRDETQLEALSESEVSDGRI